VTFPTSGTSGSRITFEGTRGSNGSFDTVLDGSDATSGWVAAPEVGSGVWKTTAIAYQPQSLISNGKMIWRISNRAMNGEILFGVGETGFKVLARSATSTAGTAFGTVTYWDGVEALFGYRSGVTYVRFRNGNNPATMNVRSAPSGGVLTLSGRSNIILKNFKVMGGQYAVRIQGGSSNIIENNDLRHGVARVLLDGGTASNIIRNNEIIQDSLATTTFLTGDHSATSYARTVMRHQYSVDKFLVGETTESSTGVELTGNPTNNEISGNNISLGAVGVKVWESSGTLIANNTIHNIGAEGIWGVGTSSGTRVTGNFFYDSEHHIRIQVERNITMYIYANRFFQPLLSGKHIHFSIIGSNVTAPATIWVYHNSFAGGGWATDLGFEGSFGNIPNVHIINNLFSVDGLSSTGSTGGAELTSNYSDNMWHSNTIPDFVLPAGHKARDSGADLITRGLPGMTTTYYQDSRPDIGAIQGISQSTIPPPPNLRATIK
jgi:parallel beta-helix repeat protein